MQVENLVALPSGLEGAGLITWWDLSGRVHPETLAEAFADEGLDLSPPITTPANALKQAVGKMVGKAASRTHGVLAVKSTRDAWFLVERHLLDDGKDVSLAAFARVEVVGSDFRATAMREGRLDLAQAVCDLAARLLASTASWSLSAWLCKTHGSAFAAVTLRASGGLYYIPPAKRAMFTAFWRAMGYVSNHRATTIDALPTEETVAAVTEALKREYDTAFAELEAELTSGVSMTKKGRATRLAHLEGLRAKLGSYADLLGGAVNVLDEKVEEALMSLALAS